MSKIITFVRINSNNESYNSLQRDNLSIYVKQHNIEVTKNIEIQINSSSDEKNLLKLLESCKKGTTLIVYSLNAFGRTIDNILEILKFFLDSKIRVRIVKQNLDLINSDDMLTKMILGVIAMTIDLEKNLMSLRTKEALSIKKLEGKHLGKPKGTIQKSKFDKQRAKIEELLGVGLSVRKISKLLGYSNHIGLNNYVKKRNIRQHVSSSLEFAS